MPGRSSRSDRLSRVKVGFVSGLSTREPLLLSPDMIIITYSMEYIKAVKVTNIPWNICMILYIAWNMFLYYNYGRGGEGAAQEGGCHMEGRYKGYTEAQNKATQKYKQANTENLTITIRKGGKQSLREVAEAAGQSMAEYVCDAVNEKAGRKVISSKVEKEDG